ncbi:DUF3341 domain-containing protein [Pseudomonas sp. RIT-PI-AD]|uniref:DUF3341 domain-containing protein n=1 Tax=Pseudomonas sp. RIT-PI-AD TaxID=3035294 RepID=UPI0021D828CA|nr:DUF3341 domain-containing protein [Pseudomonas sp. RIT-PI-AD]
MTEPRGGLLAEFADPRGLVDAARAARAQGYRRLEAFSPFPLEELEGVLAPRDRRVSWIAFAGGSFGVALGLFMQVGGSLDYPLNIGGRPLVALPSFVVVSFLLGVFFAAASAVLGMLLLCRLPLLHHPLFDGEAFARASDDRFFLLIEASDPAFDPQATAAWLGERALSVSEVTA